MEVQNIGINWNASSTQGHFNDPDNLTYSQLSRNGHGPLQDRPLFKMDTFVLVPAFFSGILL